jgi:aryl-alcohol dehydrogenase-like predicted oxidoreductase
MEKTIKLRSLGRTGMMVSPIGLGCWQFSKQNNLAGKFWPNLEDEVIDRVVSLSLEGGISWFDTAEAPQQASEEPVRYATPGRSRERCSRTNGCLFRFASNM